jgi:EAL domain-containing protein (putative c-di-GMP-specific phosphodiesterase class I)
MVLENVEMIIEKMECLNQIGIDFSMDDFGTGYSSLSCLKRLPLKQLKIDQSFVRDITTDPNDAAIVQAIISLSKSLNYDVIAEGVETNEQRQFLFDNGCSQYQGYLFSRPLPINEFDKLVSTQ